MDFILLASTLFLLIDFKGRDFLFLSLQSGLKLAFGAQKALGLRSKIHFAVRIFLLGSVVKDPPGKAT